MGELRPEEEGGKENQARAVREPTHKTPAAYNFCDIYNFLMTTHCDVINAMFLNFIILISLQNLFKLCWLSVEGRRRSQEVGDPLASFWGPKIFRIFWIFIFPPGPS